MNKQALVKMHVEIDEALVERQSLGEFDANAKHMILLLRNIRALVEHAISQATTEKK